MKNRKTYLLRGLLVLLAAALVLAAALPGLGLSTGGPTPLPQAQADPLRPEGQSQSPQTPPDQPEEPGPPAAPPAPGGPRFAVWRNCRQRVPDPAATFLIVSGKIGEADGFRPGRGIRLHGGRPEIGNGVFVPGQRFPRSASLSFSGFSSSSQSNQGNSRRPPSEKRV